MSVEDLLVVGGGPAGLAAAISAAAAGRRVTLCEGGTYGRDKVCGEFLSPEVADDFDALGCGDWIDALVPVPLRSVLLTAPSGAELTLRLPGRPAWGLSRRSMESFLAGRARAAGVRVLERTPVRALEARAGDLHWRAAGCESAARAVILAVGKRSALDASLELPRAHRPERYAAVKAYFDSRADDVLEADVELHLVPGGYVGLNPVEDGRLALCALTSWPHGATTDWPALAELFARSPRLAERLARAGRPTGALRGLARFGFGAQRLHHGGRGAPPALLCGDAARMMPSFTGDGMAVALRSGRLAARATLSRAPVAAYRLAYHREFASRLAVAALVHRVFFHPALFGFLAPILDRSPRVTSLLVDWTRAR